MSIELVEIESVHGQTGQQRMIFYKAQDHLGAWHKYGPVITVDDSFDADSFKTVVAGKIESRLAEEEFNALLEEE